MTFVLEKMFYILIYLAILPSGSVSGVPVKLIYSLVYIFGILLFFKGRVTLNKNVINIIASVFISMLIWIPISFINGFFNTSLQFAKSLLSLVIVVVIASISIDSGVVNAKKITTVMRNATVIMVAFKIILSILLVLKIISITQCQDFIEGTLGSELMWLPYQIGGLVFYRLSTPNDAISLIYYSYFICIVKDKIPSKIFSIIIMLFFVIISFSRVIIAQYVFITIIGIYIILKNIIKSRKFKNIFYFFVCILILVGIILVNRNTISNMFNTVFSTRFSGAQVNYSDGIRSEQIEKLFNSFANSPLVGYGMGSYVRSYIRSITSPFSYEMEYLSFLNQFGILGFLTLIGVLAGSFYNLILRNSSKTIKWLLYLNYFFWIIRPFFNPYFLSSTSGMTIVYIMVLSYIYSSTRKDGMIDEKE